MEHALRNLSIRDHMDDRMDHTDDTGGGGPTLEHGSASAIPTGDESVESENNYDGDISERSDRLLAAVREDHGGGRLYSGTPAASLQKHSGVFGVPGKPATRQSGSVPFGAGEQPFGLARATLTSTSAPPKVSDEEKRKEAPRDAAGQILSYGSRLHASGECSPCLFHRSGRCVSKELCDFCHYSHSTTHKRVPRGVAT